jgi:hypothetical protein
MMNRGGNIKQVIERYADETSKEMLRDLMDIIGNFVEDMSRNHPHEVETLMRDIHSIVEPFMYDEDARVHLRDIRNEDGTRGAHWTKTQTDEMARKYGIDTHSDKYNDWDFHTAMNLAYATMYHRDFRDDHYVSLAKTFWLDDKDWNKNGRAQPGKVKWYVNNKTKYLRQ